MKRAVATVDVMVAGERAAAIIAVNPEKVMKAQHDAGLRQFLWNTGLLIPDGIGVVLAVRLLEGEHIERVPGAELMPAICARAAERGYTVFLFGASEEVNRRAAEVLVETYPGLRVAGRHHGYVNDAEMPAVIEKINACRPDVVFIALGSPKQELWLDRWLPELQVKVCQGVGGTFDVIAGRVQRAPEFFRRNHLEWFYRLLKQPQRAFRQTALLSFMGRVLLSKLRGERSLPPADWRNGPRARQQ